jgi:very-short-patch-repair endonuclease
MTTERARELRQLSTPPERKLWQILHEFRQRGYHFRRQHPIGPYYADFACVKAKLVIEADGVTHTSEADIARDRARTALLSEHGFQVLRFWNNDIVQNPDGVFLEIERALKSMPELTPTPVPSPLEGGGRPRSRKLRTGLKDLAARTGGAVGLPSPVGGVGQHAPEKGGSS